LLVFHLEVWNFLIFALECWQEYRESLKHTPDCRSSTLSPHPGNDIWSLGIVLLEHLAGVSLHGSQKSALHFIKWMHGKKDCPNINEKLRYKAERLSLFLLEEDISAHLAVEYPLLVQLCLRMTEMGSPSARASAVAAIDLLECVPKGLSELPLCIPTNQVFILY
jgi:serine/threonine protein kinase